MKNIILTGMMGCGKSTCAALLGEKLGRTVVDTDDLVVEKAGMSIADLFAAQGETAMRDIETQVCRELSGKTDLIIATGGGLPLREENRTLLRETGTVVFLNRDPGEIYDTADMSGRPLGQQGRDAFLERFAAREPIYRAFAHVVITNFSTPEATAAEILAKLEELL
jgi:shikimate kinase